VCAGGVGPVYEVPSPYVHTAAQSPVEASVIVAVVDAPQISGGLTVKLALPPMVQVEFVKASEKPALVLL
jgi:hypothetical protein